MVDKLVEISSGSRIQPINTPVEVVEIGSPGMPGLLIIHNGMLYLYSDAGETLIDGGIIQTGAILANAITADKVTVNQRNLLHDIVWTATDSNTCSWSAGTIYWPDGTTTSISSGNTGNIVATTYIYFDGTSTLKTTTTITTAVAETKKNLVIVELGGTDGKCVITPVNSTGTTIDGGKIVTGLIQSSDGKTFFDLNNGRIVVNDGNDNRIVIGKI